MNGTKGRMMLRILALAAALVFSPWSVVAQTTTTPTPEQRRMIEQIVREYLIANPEVLRDAFNALERREQENQARTQSETIERYADQLFRTGRHAVLGNPNGDVTIVEFFDYNCGFCRRAHADMQEIIRADSGIRWVLKEFPVLGPGSVEAAQISAQLIGHPRFAEFHNRMLSERGQVGKDRALAIARELGMDARALERGMATDGPRQVIQEAYSLANTLNLGGTPTYVIGREIVVGAVGAAQLRVKIEAMRRCGQTTC
jgi:protein-disulfide isomerase